MSAEKAASSQKPSNGSWSILGLLGSIRNNKALTHSAHNEDENKIRDGVLKRAGDQMIHLASQVKVRPEEVEERTAEMFNAAVFVAAAAAVAQEGKQPKFDFFLM